ncbi:hypothetical protein SCLCIDRAFT_112603, partial [Scleroderma citrinum Foug A]
GFEHIPGGWFMAVMDRHPNEYVSLHDRTTVSVCFGQPTEAVSQKWLYQWQHLIWVPSDNSKKFMMIDFDFPGMVGIVQYQRELDVNRNGIWRPDDVHSRELIQVEHDLAMLNHITSSYNLVM